MNNLERHIREVIATQGSLSVAAYMNMALQHPDYGYYRQHDPFGCAGDFITAPEISQMFGEMIGLWCADTWHQMGKPENFTLLELGPGRGALMQDALRVTTHVTGFHAAMNVCLIESNAGLRQIQKDRLSVYRPRHLESINQLPEQPTLVIANEFFDALPIRQFEQTTEGWSERLVGIRDDQLCFILSKPDPSLPFVPNEMRHAKPFTVYEMSPESLYIVRDLSHHLTRYSGVALVMDYGFREPSGRSTFQAIAQHAYVDVFERPGEVDLTAHVDFGALGDVASKQQAHVSNVLDQGAFLKGLGIEHRAEQLKHKATLEQAEGINSALHRLTDNTQMGALFKAMAISSPHFSALAGF